MKVWVLYNSLSFYLSQLVFSLNTLAHEWLTAPSFINFPVCPGLPVSEFESTSTRSTLFQAWSSTRSCAHLSMGDAPPRSLAVEFSTERILRQGRLTTKYFGGLWECLFEEKEELSSSPPFEDIVALGGVVEQYWSEVGKTWCSAEVTWEPDGPNEAWVPLEAPFSVCAVYGDSAWFLGWYGTLPPEGWGDRNDMLNR